MNLPGCNRYDFGRGLFGTGGLVIWGNDTSNDFFVSSHGVRTPDYFYKVVIRGTGSDERAIAWVAPNSMDATKRNLDQYLVSIADLETLTGQSFPVADYAKHDKPTASLMAGLYL